MIVTEGGKNIYPEDIETIEVLKGPAAAAQYGTAAANGVIQVTTKRGRSGKPSWTTYLEGGNIKDVTDYPANFLRTTNTSTATSGEDFKPRPARSPFPLDSNGSMTVFGFGRDNDVADPNREKLTAQNNVFTFGIASGGADFDASKTLIDGVYKDVSTVAGTAQSI